MIHLELANLLLPCFILDLQAQTAWDQPRITRGVCWMHPFDAPLLPVELLEVENKPCMGLGRSKSRRRKTARFSTFPPPEYPVKGEELLTSASGLGSHRGCFQQPPAQIKERGRDLAWLHLPRKAKFVPGTRGSISGCHRPIAGNPIL